MWKSLLLTTTFVAMAVPAVSGAAAKPAAESRLDMTVGGRTLPVTRGGEKAWAYQWPSVTFEAHFSGNDVTLAFDDPSNNLNVIVDGRTVAVLKKPGAKRFSLHQLGTGPHTIRLEKRSETQYAVGAFKGFFVPAKADALPAPAYSRAIEFIGDSFTVGYGNTSAFTKCTPEDVFETTDSQSGFGPLVAKHFKALYQVDAFSGLGMVRNFDGHEHPKYHMPMLYPRALFDDATPDPAAAAWHPQIIVVGIGGNDFSTPLHDDEPWKSRDALIADHEKTYVAFVRMLRAKNPDAFILLARPENRPDYTAATTAVFDAIHAEDKKVDLVTLPQTDNTGCNGHPNVHDDAKVADMYIAYIEAHPELWQGR